MTEKVFEELLIEAVEDGDLFEGAEAHSFDDHGILSGNRGLIITLANGDEFQVTIVQSLRAITDEGENEDDV